MKRIWASKSTIGFHLLIHAMFLSYISKKVYTYYRLNNYFLSIYWEDFLFSFEILSVPKFYSNLLTARDP